MKTTTDPDHWKFSFTINDVALFLGKSPVTLRGWERKKLVSFPRFEGAGDRRLKVQDLRQVAQKAHSLKRITKERLRLIEATLTMIEIVERENSK